jgi:predicted Fe-Mo cluster-binding NifX family protein
MKIAVPAQDGSLDAKIDMHFGRARCFVVVDSDTWEFTVADNKQNVQALAGAGIQAAQIVADQDADVVIANNCGPKAFRTLKAANIEVFVGVNGTVREAINLYKDGKLKPAGDANVESHSGIL